MLKKMLTKKNNKGFSLVELIVVVLIIAIIAVALAPQVMKWVGKAEENTNENSAAVLKSTVQTVVAEYISEGGIIGAGNFTVTGTTYAAGTATLTDGTLSFATLMTEAISDFDGTTTFTVTLGAGGNSVAVTY